MGTNTGIGIGIGIPFKNNALGGDRPYLPPELKARLIGVWDNYGKKNTDADRNIIKNKIPNAGGDLEILNAAYKLNSGFGEYKEDFTSWRIYPNIEVTDNVITTNGNFNSTWFIYKHANENEINEMNIKVSGIPEGGIIRYFYIPDETATIPVSYNISEDGVYHLPKSKLSSNKVSVGFIVSRSYDWNNIRIEQLSDFGGAFVTDGINDIIISQKTLQEMGVTKDFTIVSMIHQISWRGSGYIPLTNYIRPTDNIYVRNQVADIGKTGIYGYVVYDIKNSTVGNSHIVNTILGDKNDYSIYTIGDLSQGKFSVQGYIDGNSNIRETSSVAHYWTFALLGKATEDDINLIIAYFNLDRTLKPDILCNIERQGITNDNHADFNDKLIDYSGNGRDIQMYNLAWKGGSGVAAKQYETFKDWTSTSSSTSIITEIDEFTRIIESTTNSYWVSMIRRNSDFDKVHEPVNIILYQDDILLVHECKYKVGENVQTKALYDFLDSGTHTIELYTLDRFTDIPENAEIMSLGEWLNPRDGNGSIKYSLIPSCKGGILLDGINDFGKVTGMPIYKDYTLIADRYIENNVGSVASKSVDSNQYGAFIFEIGKNNFSFNTNSTGSTNLNKDRTISYLSKYSYNGENVNVGNEKDSDSLWLGTIRDNETRFSNIAIYSLMSFPYSMSEFLIERQLKKHKLGTLYPNMVEFRPIIKANDNYKIFYTAMLPLTGDIWERINIGDYVPVGRRIAIQMSFDNEAKKLVSAVSSQLGNITIVKNSNNIGYTIFGDVLKDKSPQKIGITIEQDENYVLFNPTINSNVILEVGNEQNITELTDKIRNHEIDGFIMYLSKLESKYILPNSWINKDTEVIASIYCLDNTLQDDLHINIDGNSKYCLYADSSNNIAEFIIMDDNIFEEQYITNVLTANTIDIQLDQYIRYEDIVQPYPVLLRFNDENGNEVSWGGKFRVGSTITRIGSAADSNLLPNIYNIFGLLLNDNQVTSSKVIVEKTMVFKAKSAYIFDNNEPKCILSPSRLRIPNSSYKLLGYIPDISGHGNHGVIHNSAYAEGSGVNEDGSYQFDGVDDFVTIPTVTGGKQVLMKVNWQSSIAQAMLYDQRGTAFAIWNSDKFNDNEVDTVPAYSARNGGNTYIDGILNKNILASQLRNITHNIVSTNNMVNENSVSPNIGCALSNSYYSQMSLYDFMLFDNISTDDKIKELNEYVGIEAKVELPPYYWDAYGKTNLDEDKATIQQRGVAVGDYDLTNYNHAYDKMSGYGGYSLGRFDKSWASSSSNNTSVIVVSRNPYDITLKKLGGNSDWEFNNTELKVISNPVSVKFKSNKNIRVTCDYHYYPVGGNSEGTPLGITSKDLIANKDAIITISPISQENIDKYNIDVNRGYYLIYFQLSSTLAVNEEVTIEMLPLYPNGLVYDGVTDYSENANIPAFTDFTYILKRQILKGIANSAVMYKDNITVNQGGAFICNYCEPSDTNLFTDFSFGGLLRSNDIDKPIIYGTKTSVNGDSITPDENIDTVGINVGKWVNYLPMVLYKLILYPKTIPLLQINFLKNLMERDEIIDLDNPIFKK